MEDTVSVLKSSRKVSELTRALWDPTRFSCLSTTLGVQRGERTAESFDTSPCSGGQGKTEETSVCERKPLTGRI